MRVLRSIVPALAGVVVTVAALFGAFDAAAGPPPPPGTSYIVDTTSDADLQTCGAGANDCSFRGAINKANAHISIDPDRIQFQIGSGLKTIVPATPLPAITDEVIIDATTQPSPQPQPCIVVLGRPCILLDGSSAGGDAWGLNVDADSAKIRGLAIYSFSNGQIRIAGTSPSDIERNYIGTPDGVASSTGNQQFAGIYVENEAPGTVIGGKTATLRNIISGNPGAGIDVFSGDGTVIQGNYIGTSADGSGTVPNKLSGIILFASSTIGGSEGTTPGGGCAGDCNLISGNTQNGISAVGSQTIQGNVVGLNVGANAAIPNGGDGIRWNLSGLGTIGGTQGSQRNVISGNDGDGIHLIGGGTGTADDIFIQGNYIGVKTNGKQAAGNQRNGILIDDGSSVIIGGTSAGARNIISANAKAGVQIGGTGNGSSDDNQVLGNYIGVDADGANELGNADGVRIDVLNGTAHGNVIGGTAPGAGNLISGNETGIRIDGAGVTGTLIQGNTVGLNLAGSAPAPNTTGFLGISASDVTIGGPVAARNVISGNTGDGVSFTAPDGSANDNTVAGNYIGVGPDGTQPFANGLTGVQILSSGGGVAMGNVIGGDDPAEKNVIVAAVGVSLSGGGTHHNSVTNNLVKVDATGTVPLGEGLGTGVQIGSGAHENTVAANTMVSGEFGLRIVSGALANIVRSNFIGTNAVGDQVMGNSKDGVSIDNASDNLIGADDSGEGANVIMNNGENGVLITGNAIHNTLSANSIFNNDLLGIEEEPPANDVQAPPVLGTAQTGSTSITGTMEGGPNETFRLEFFSIPHCDASGTGEGLTYLGATNVTTNSFGMVSFGVTLQTSTPPGYSVSATATDVDGNTSQFSNCASVTGNEGSATPAQTATATPTPAPSATPSSTPTPSGHVQLMGDADCNGQVATHDVIAALSESIGVRPGAGCHDLANADCDSDVDALDSLRILRFVAGKPQTPPGGCSQVGSPP